MLIILSPYYLIIKNIILIHFIIIYFIIYFIIIYFIIYIITYFYIISYIITYTILDNNKNSLSCVFVNICDVFLVLSENVRI